VKKINLSLSYTRGQMFLSSTLETSINSYRKIGIVSNIDLKEKLGSFRQHIDFFMYSSVISYYLLFPVALRPSAGHGLLIFEVSRSHTTTHHSR